METLQLFPILLEDGTTAYAALSDVGSQMNVAAVVTQDIGLPQPALQIISPMDEQIDGTVIDSVDDGLSSSPLKIDLSRGGADDEAAATSAIQPDASSQTKQKRRSKQTSPCDPPTKCSHCGHETKTVGAMTLHLRTHTNERPFVCPECSKAFKTSTDFARHRRTHTGERPYSCNVEGCGMSFKTSAQRAVHARRHTGEKPYSCDFQGCGKTFVSMANLTDHKRVHSSDRPFLCRYDGCEKRYADYSSLHKHHSTHDPSKRFPCGLCGKTYGQISTLRLHERTKHDRVRIVGQESASREEQSSLKKQNTGLSAEFPSTPTMKISRENEKVSVVRVEQSPISDITCLSLII